MCKGKLLLDSFLKGGENISTKYFIKWLRLFFVYLKRITSIAPRYCSKTKAFDFHIMWGSESFYVIVFKRGKNLMISKTRGSFYF